MRKFYSAAQIITVENNLVAKAKKFSNEVFATTNYADTNQTQTLKIRDDHFISKIGEEAAKKILSRYGTVMGPDYTIYAGKEKSWNDDLFLNNIGIAVKTQKRSAALRYSLSWIFQASHPRRDIILDKPEAWVVFVEFNDMVSDKFECKVFPPYQIKELIFGEPKLEYLKAHKKVVYANNLPAL